MNQVIKKVRRAERIKREREKGFTLLETLVALAVIALLIAITAVAIQERASNTRVNAVAGQVGQVFANHRAREVVNPAFNVTMAGLAAELSAITDSIDGLGITTANVASCGSSGADRNGLSIVVPTGAYSALEDAQQLREAIVASINAVYAGAAAPTLQNVYTFTGTPTGGITLAAQETMSTDPATTIPICVAK